jgi:ubiquinone/menaquinone biosynthesis C-methylase UbiE
VRQSSISFYRCPADGSALRLQGAPPLGELESGFLQSAAGRRYPIEHGVPNLIYPETLSAIETETKVEYDRVADEIYDVAVTWQFAAFLEDEDKVREGMVDLLTINPGHRVLEVGCGTGRDSFRIARRLGKDGALFMQDISPRMVLACVRKMAEYDRDMHFACDLEYSASNASYLPFPDDTFDAVFHFGGFNQFGDLKKGASELTRVAKEGGRILIGDEAVAPWLKGTEFEGIVTTNNALFKADIPLHTLPASARDVTVKWLIANCFYAIAFTKGDGPPPLDLDLKHKGWRGGSMRTRYFGVLEGVTPEAKALACEAAAATGMSVHDWLDRLVKEAANKALKS